MADDEAFIWERPTPQRRPRPRPDEGTDQADRISLRDAERRFGVKVSTLRTWARKGRIDAVMASGAGGERWMVTPESVAHHLSRKKPSVTSGHRVAPARRGGPTENGAMLVPRDAWDKLMEQLGNLHEAGLQLAEARERAAKAETESTFLRERLGEMRSERDQLRERVGEGPPKRRWWRRG